MAITVAFDGTVVNASDANTNWNRLNEGGGAPSAEGQLAYQNALVVNNKCTKTGGSFSGVEYDPGASPIDMTAAAYPLCFLQMIVSDSFDLNTTFGGMVYIGSSSGDFNIYNFAGSGAPLSVFNTWPNQGGYILTGLNPTVAAWEDASSPTGSPAFNAVDYFAFQASFVNGAAKAENVALDQISIGRGLIMTGSTPDGTYEDFVDQDQDTPANRWGVVRSASGILYSVGKLTVGPATACSFTDSGTVIMVFPDGYVDSGDLGELYDLQHASTDVWLGASQLIGGGSSTTSETRPSLTVSGTTGAFEADGAIRTNYENITFTSVCDVHNADLECELLTQASCDLYDSTIRTTALTNVATLQDPTFAQSTDLHDTEFIQAGAGHAIEIDTASTYNFYGLTFTGYGGTPGSNPTPSSGASDAMIYNSSGGTVTINILGGGDNVSVRNAASSDTVVVSGAVTVTVTAQTTAGAVIENANVFLRTKTGGTGPLPENDTVTISNSGSTATVTHATHGMEDDDYVYIEVDDSNTSTIKDANNGVFQITVNDAGEYEYSMGTSPGSSPSGTNKAWFVFLKGLTDVNGEIDMSRVIASDQDVEGWSAKASGSPYYKNGSISGTVSSSVDTPFSAVMPLDE